MRDVLFTAWRQDDGVLSFEWVLVTTLLVIGIVGGIAAARDALIDELGDVAQAMLALDGSYTIAYPLQLAVSDDGTTPVVVGRASDSSFLDAALSSDCSRSTQPVGQIP